MLWLATHLDLGRRLDAGAYWLETHKRPPVGESLPLDLSEDGATYVVGGARGPVVRAWVRVAGYLLDRARIVEAEMPYRRVSRWSPPPVGYPRELATLTA